MMVEKIQSADFPNPVTESELVYEALIAGQAAKVECTSRYRLNATRNSLRSYLLLRGVEIDTRSVGLTLFVRKRP
jgi:hypothetical protein